MPDNKTEVVSETFDTHEAAAWAAERRYAPTSFGEIAYVQRGEGPVALFLHGFPPNGFQWRGAMARLADVRRRIAPDVLGLGYYTRPRPGQTVTFNDQAAMLAELLDRLQTGPVDVAANDSNTGVAQLLAADSPTPLRPTRPTRRGNTIIGRTRSGGPASPDRHSTRGGGGTPVPSPTGRVSRPGIWSRWRRKAKAAAAGSWCCQRLARGAVAGTWFSLPSSAGR